MGTTHGYTCWTTTIFGTQKDGSLKIISLTLNYCFTCSYINVLQNSVMALSKMVLKTQFFCQKSSNFVHFGPYDFFQISPACNSSTYQIMYAETLDYQCQHLKARKIFNGKFTAKLIFRSDILCYH